MYFSSPLKHVQTAGVARHTTPFKSCQRAARLQFSCFPFTESPVMTSTLPLKLPATCVIFTLWREPLGKVAGIAVRMKNVPDVNKYP